MAMRPTYEIRVYPATLRVVVPLDEESTIGDRGVPVEMDGLQGVVNTYFAQGPMVAGSLLFSPEVYHSFYEEE